MYEQEPSSYRNVADIFDKLDRDQSGYVDVAELEHSVTEHGYSKEVAIYLMRELDVECATSASTRLPSARSASRTHALSTPARPRALTQPRRSDQHP